MAEASLCEHFKLNKTSRKLETEPWKDIDQSLDL